MSYKVLDVDPGNNSCHIEYNGEKIFFHYDYYAGRFYGASETFEYDFLDIPGGAVLDKVFKYKTISEQFNSPEFMQAVMTEMVRHEIKRR